MHKIHSVHSTAILNKFKHGMGHLACFAALGALLILAPGMLDSQTSSTSSLPPLPVPASSTPNPITSERVDKSGAFPSAPSGGDVFPVRTVGSDPIPRIRDVGRLDDNSSGDPSQPKIIDLPRLVNPASGLRSPIPERSNIPQTAQAPSTPSYQRPSTPTAPSRSLPPSVPVSSPSPPQGPFFVDNKPAPATSTQARTAPAAPTRTISRSMPSAPRTTTPAAPTRLPTTTASSSSRSAAPPPLPSQGVSRPELGPPPRRITLDNSSRSSYERSEPSPASYSRTPQPTLPALPNLSNSARSSRYSGTGERRSTSSPASVATSTSSTTSAPTPTRTAPPAPSRPSAPQPIRTLPSTSSLTPSSSVASTPPSRTNIDRSTAPTRSAPLPSRTAPPRPTTPAPRPTREQPSYAYSNNAPQPTPPASTPTSTSRFVPPAPSQPPIASSSQKTPPKQYLNAGWSSLQQSPQNQKNKEVAMASDVNSTIDQKLNEFNKLEDQRNKDMYTGIMAGMQILAAKQDETNSQLSDIDDRISNQQERIDSLESKPTSRAPSYRQGSRVPGSTAYSPGTSSSGWSAPSATSTPSEVTPSQKSKVTPLDFATVRGAEGEYLLSILRDIIANPSEYLYWNGYLTEAGPPAMRFAAQEFQVDRRDLIPLTTPEHELDQDELFPPQNDITEVPITTDGELLRPKYTGHVGRLSRDQVLDLLGETGKSDSGYPVRFELPLESGAPDSLESPNSYMIFEDN